jgi:hypothetical protein
MTAAMALNAKTREVSQEKKTRSNIIFEDKNGNIVIIMYMTAYAVKSCCVVMMSEQI